MSDYIVFILFNIPPLVILVGAFILFFKGQCNKSVRISMSALLWLLAVAMGVYAQFYNPVTIQKQVWLYDFLFCMVVPFCPPAYFLFLNRLTDRKKTPGLNILVFLPAIIYAAMMFSATLFMSDSERHAFVANEIMGQSIQMESTIAYEWMVFLVKRFFGVFITIEGILVMIYGEFRLNVYVHLLEEYFTTKNAIKMRKVRGIHTMSILVASLFLFMAVIPLADASNMLWFLGIVLIIEMIMVSLIISYVMRIEYSAEDLYTLMDEGTNTNNLDYTVHDNDNTVGSVASHTSYTPVVKNDVINSVRTLEPISPLIERIDAAMGKDNLFLRPDLSIVMLAEQVGTNRTYVSKAIKDTKGCNFSDYVNRFRLDYAIELMKSLPKDQIVVQNIAVQCGCGSIQTFYRYFKLFFNETPTQWIERNK